jgi:hypothetical protein
MRVVPVGCATSTYAGGKPPPSRTHSGNVGVGSSSRRNSPTKSSAILRIVLGSSSCTRQSMRDKRMPNRSRLSVRVTRLA